jgi:hypothetical protein
MSRSTWIAVALAALAGVGLVVWRQDGGRETIDVSAEPIAVTVAGHALRVPKNAIRFPAQRLPGPQPRLDLALLPPDWSGRTPQNADRFDEPAERSSVVWVTLAPAAGELDSAARLATVYARLFVGEPLEAPDALGLTGRRLSPQAGYAGEEVWFEPGVVRPFVARCYPLAPDAPVAACVGEETAAGLTVTRRFSRARLADWRELRAGLAARLADWGVPTP